MKTATGRWVAIGAAAGLVLMTAPLAASASALASDGGTITFSGAVVAPQLAVSATPGAAGVRLALQGTAVTLTFSAPPGVIAGADVALQVNGGATPREAVAARFVDSDGRLAAASRDGHYKVGRDGGVMSLSAQRAAPETRVTVVMSYD